MFSFSDKARAKLTARILPLLPAGSPPPVTVVRGVAGAVWTTRAMVIAGVFGGAFVIALAAGVVLIPGGLGLLFFVRELRPIVLLAPSPAGLHVVRLSTWSGRPKAVVAVQPLGPFPAHDGRGSVDWAGRPVKLAKKEYQELLKATAMLSAAAAGPGLAPAAMGPMAPPPPPPGPAPW